MISRKISGGTRSEAGSGSKMTLASLFGTWRARGLNPFLETRRLLIFPSTLNSYDAVCTRHPDPVKDGMS